MKNLFLLLFFVPICFIGCKSDDVSSKENWQGICSSFYKENNGYILSACCYKVIFPDLRLRKGKSFTSQGTLKTTDVKGISTEINIEATGDLSRDGENLRVSFSYQGQVQDFSYTEKGPLMICDCACFK